MRPLISFLSLCIVSSVVLAQPAAPRKVYVGGAFNMMDLAQPKAAGWSELSKDGAQLHVHPVGWRGQWETLGAALRPNFTNPNFLYEFDIVDPRHGVDNLDEIAKVEASGFKCEAAFCNVDGREMLSNRAGLVADFTKMASAPFQQKNIPVYFTFSPVATPEIIAQTPELLRGNYWIKVARDCGAGGIGLDFPIAYWSNAAYRANLIRFIKDARQAGLPVLLIDSITTQADTDNLVTMYNGLKSANALPDAWNMSQFHNESFHLTPETKGNSTAPAGTATGAALTLYRKGFVK